MVNRNVIFCLSFLAVPAFAEAPNGYPLGPGDRIAIRALDVEEFNGQPVLIDRDGEINLPLAGRVRAAGRTVEELESEIASRLKKFLHEPQVTVTITEFQSRPVSVFGAVDRPGVHQLEGPKTLWEVISLAGGLKHEVGDTIKITRRLDQGAIPLPNARTDETGQYSIAEVEVKSVMEMTSPEQNILIMPHDVISVSRANIVYVVGHVNRPGGFVTNGKLSVLQALSLAGGFQAHANAKEARILRLKDDSQNRTQIAVNLKKVLTGGAEDLALRPDDILVIPHSGWKEFGARAAAASLAVATGVAIYRVGIDR
jgi:polysaccharide export outer membrane protein